MYDDRVEITSPGGMFNSKRIQEIDILHVLSLKRNPEISDAFHRLKYMERRGSGLKKIIKEYDEQELPVFYSDQQYFRVTLKNKNYSNRRTDQKTIKKNEELILKLIKLDPRITQSEIALQLGNISPSGVKYNLKRLKDRGLVKRIGPDKGGYWEITGNWKV